MGDSAVLAGTIWWLPPWLPLMLGALLLPLASQSWRIALSLALPVFALILVWMIPEGNVWRGQFLGMEVIPLRANSLARLFATVFVIALFAGSLYAIASARAFELSAAFAYAGASVGVAFSGDLLSLFVFWELMAVFSTVVIWSAGSEKSFQASLRYLLLHFFGGVVLMIGIVVWVVAGGALVLTGLSDGLSGNGLLAVASWCVLIGVLINAGAPPLGAWVADAYPEASISGAVFLSAFTTKTAVLVLIQLFPGAEILLWVGIAMMFYGIVMALLEDDMRRLLAFSLVGQVGYMVCAVGIGTPLALDGAAAHAFTHIVYKALLLMGAGAVLLQTGERNCSRLGDLAKYMPLTALCTVVGAMSISAMPLTSGFASKAMIVSAAGKEHLLYVWLALNVASGCALIYVGLKLPWSVFFAPATADADSVTSRHLPQEAPLTMCAAMLFMALVCVAIGIFPSALYSLLPFAEAAGLKPYNPYTMAHIISQLQLLLVSAIVFFVCKPQPIAVPGRTVDFDWFYTRFPVHLWRLVGPGMSARVGELGAAMGRACQRAESLARQSHQGRKGFARTWSSGQMARWSVATLAVAMLYYYL